MEYIKFIKDPRESINVQHSTVNGSKTWTRTSFDISRRKLTFYSSRPQLVFQRSSQRVLFLHCAYVPILQMIYTARTAQILATIALLVNGATAAQVGPCHPYPGADSPDCLQLISDNLNNNSPLSCGRDCTVTITLRNCSIVTTCNDGTDVIPDTMVRRSLTAMGACTLDDQASISGYYIADDGSKTCYLYPGR